MSTSVRDATSAAASEHARRWRGSAVARAASSTRGVDRCRRAAPATASRMRERAVDVATSRRWIDGSSSSIAREIDRGTSRIIIAGRRPRSDVAAEMDEILHEGFN